MLRGAADVAALGVEDHRHAGVSGVDVRDQAFQRVFRTESGEVRDLRLEAAGQVGGGVDDGGAELEDGVGVAAQMGGEFCRLGVEADADQGAVAMPCGLQGLHEVHRSLRDRPPWQAA